MGEDLNLIQPEGGDDAAEDNPTDLSQFISEVSLSRVTGIAVLEAELFQLDMQFHASEDNRQQRRSVVEGTGPVGEVIARSDFIRQQLRELRQAAPTGEEPLPTRRIEGRDDLSRPHLGPNREIRFSSVGAIAFPKAHPFASVRPESSKTSGFIKLTLREKNGTVHIGGIIEAEGPGNPTKLHTWLRAWNYVIPFPPPSSKSILTYNFSVYVDLGIFAEVSAGTVMSYVSVGEDSNFKLDEKISINQDVGWPLVHDLTQPAPHYNGRYGRLFGTLPVTRAFGVGGGKTPAIGVAIGIVGSISQPAASTIPPRTCSFLFGDSRIVPGTDNAGGTVVTYRYDPVEIADPT